MALCQCCQKQYCNCHRTQVSTPQDAPAGRFGPRPSFALSAPCTARHSRGCQTPLLLACKSQHMGSVKKLSEAFLNDWHHSALHGMEATRAVFHRVVAYTLRQCTSSNQVFSTKCGSLPCLCTSLWVTPSPHLRLKFPPVTMLRASSCRGRCATSSQASTRSTSLMRTAVPAVR